MEFLNLDLHVLGALVWLILAIIFAVVEGFTLGLTTIWFAAGSVVAGIAAWFNVPIYLQIIIFLVVSLILLVLTRPIAKKKLNVGHSKDIIEALQGKIALVTTDIVPFQTGQVKVNGQIWTAISDNMELHIEKGEEVTILRTEGVKLIVMPLEVKEKGE